jgi:hypothetical protein
MKTEKLKHQTHYVSPESPQHEPVPVDMGHAEVVEAHGAVNPGVTKDQTVRKHEQAEGEPELGGESQRTAKSSRATLGRHITSAPGFQVAERRHKHVTTRHKEHDKVFVRGSK